MDMRSRSERILQTLFTLCVMLAMVLAGLFLSRDHWKARISEQASQDLLMQIENGKSEIVLTSLAPEIDGENEDWVAIEGLEKLLGVDFDRPEELTEAQELAQQKKLTAKGKLEIPKISLNLPVLEGTGKVGLRYGAGWFAMSAEPGQPGNCLLFGHRMKARGRLFNRLNELVRGDTVYIADMDAQLYTYTVVDKIEVLPENLFEELYKHTDGRYLSLITCTPQGVGSHRLIILCEIQSEL